MPMEVLSRARRAVLATIAADGRPRLVPIAFASADGILYTALDEKPKRVAEPHDLARVRDILARPEVTVLVDEWHEDWTRLAWERLYGRAELLESGAAEHAEAVKLLRQRYPQYEEHRLEERPIIRVTIDRTVSWSARDDA
jgi:PPOX class probable F420-dependent enzyme